MFILNQMYAKANTARSAAKGKACTVRVAAETTNPGAAVGAAVGTPVGQLYPDPSGYTYGSYAELSQVPEAARAKTRAAGRVYGDA